jgi:hypothetical protein
MTTIARRGMSTGIIGAADVLKVGTQLPCGEVMGTDAGESILTDQFNSWKSSEVTTQLSPTTSLPTNALSGNLYPLTFPLNQCGMELLSEDGLIFTFNVANADANTLTMQPINFINYIQFQVGGKDICAPNSNTIPWVYLHNILDYCTEEQARTFPAMGLNYTTGLTQTSAANQITTGNNLTYALNIGNPFGQGKFWVNNSNPGSECVVIIWVQGGAQIAKTFAGSLANLTVSAPYLWCSGTKIHPNAKPEFVKRYTARPMLHVHTDWVKAPAQGSLAYTAGTLNTQILNQPRLVDAVAFFPWVTANTSGDGPLTVTPCSYTDVRDSSGGSLSGFATQNGIPQIYSIGLGSLRSSASPLPQMLALNVLSFGKFNNLWRRFGTNRYGYRELQSNYFAYVTFQSSGTYTNDTYLSCYTGTIVDYSRGGVIKI